MAGWPRTKALRLAHELVGNENAREGLPASWDEWSADQRLQWMLGMNLAQAAHVCTWDVNTLDMGHLAIWDRVRHGLWTTCLRIAERPHDRALDQAALDELARRLSGKGPGD
jgi:hypothetical protein